MRTHSRHRGQSGFSLIEVMIAVIVLATGLLALAALQINLTSSSADAKARSRMAALVSATMDYERSLGFSSVTAFTNTACTTTTPTTIQSYICTAESDAGVSGIQLTQAVTEYYAIASASSFSTTAPTTVQIAADPDYGDYKLVKLTATWTDATGGARSFATTSIVNDTLLNGSKSLLTQNITTNGSLTPAVHETNPSNTAGVIPIAVGTNTNSAATNPKPTVASSGASSTNFTTLTYTQGTNDGTQSSTIQKRVETTVAECVCQGSSSNPFTDTVFLGKTTYRPTYWNGTQYSSPVDAKITPYSSAASSVTQSDLCNQCCRDHHDIDKTNTAATAPLYDAVTGNSNRYKVATTTSAKGAVSITTPIALAGTVGSRVPATLSSDPYLDSCRLIRIDGIWRVAADLEAAHMGLIATTAKGFATSSVPDSTVAVDYQRFVIDYLGQYLTYVISGGSAPSATSVFNTPAYDLNAPASIDATTVSGNYRYLHARGLYVDHLETDAVTKLTNVNSTCASTNFPTCLLPYLPFSTINLTGVGYNPWSSSSNSNLTVGSGTDNGTTGVCSSSNFFGGCVSGKANTSLATITVTMGHSNSTLAASLPVSPYEEVSANKLTDTQDFKVTGTSTADQYYAQLSGPTVTLTDPTTSAISDTVTWLTSDLSTTNDPTVQWGVGLLNALGSDACFSSISRIDTDPNPYDCVTTVLTTTLPINTTVGNYNQVINNPISNPCSGGTGSYNQPTLVCYTVASASLTSNSAGTSFIDCLNKPGGKNCFNITTPFTVTNSKTSGETTAITIASTNGTPASTVSNSFLNLVFTANGTQAATYTCDSVSHIPTFTTPTSCP